MVKSALCLLAALLVVGLAAAVEAASVTEVVEVGLEGVETRRERLFRLGKLDADYVERQSALLARKFLPSALGASAGGEPLVNVGDSSYTATINVGRPPQSFRCALDSASANWWVVDRLCGQSKSDCNWWYCKREQSCKYINVCQTNHCCKSFEKDPELYENPCDGKNKYDSDASTTYHQLSNSRPWSIQYGYGSVGGHLDSDIVGLDVNGTTVLPVRQVFGAATKLSQYFAGQPIDGVCGLGWPAIAVDHITPWVQNLIAAGSIAPLFTVFMSAKKGPGGGQITFGGLDTAHCASGTPDWVPLTATGYWQFQASAVGTADGAVNEAIGQVISDTGTSLLQCPGAVVDKLAKAVGATFNNDYGLYVMDCQPANAPPDLTVTIAGKLFTISRQNFDIPLGSLDGTSQCIFAATAFNGGGSGIDCILGDTWIREYCNVYDVGNKRVGFLKAIA